MQNEWTKIKRKFEATYPDGNKKSEGVLEEMADHPKLC